MLLLVSGEGPSDMGSMRPLVDGLVFVPGPMTVLVNCLLEAQLFYSLLDLDSVRFVAKAELVEAWPKHHGRQFRAPGKRKPKEAGFYFENARRLALKAEELARQTEDRVLPILFRDADGTQSSGRGEWQAKWNSMLDGFAAGESTLGVPMLPQPKSEAWLLCACREPVYQHCERLEHESGNDDAPNPLKGQLAHARNGATSAAELVDAIHDGEIDPQRIDMSSFNAFKARLNEVMGQLVGGG